MYRVNGDRLCFVYFIGVGDTFKIGITSNLEKRFYAIKNASPTKIKLELLGLYCFSNEQSARAVKRNLRLRLDNFRINADWFSIDAIKEAKKRFTAMWNQARYG